VEILANFGLVSLIFFEYSFFSSIKRDKTKEKEIKRFLMSIVILMIIGMFVVVQTADKLYYLQLALVCAISRISNPSENLISIKYSRKKYKNEGKENSMNGDIKEDEEKKNERKIRIMQIIPSLGAVGGAEIFSLELSKNFDTSRTEVIYVSLYPKPSKTLSLEKFLLSEDIIGFNVNNASNKPYVVNILRVHNNGTPSFCFNFDKTDSEYFFALVSPNSTTPFNEIQFKEDDATYILIATEEIFDSSWVEQAILSKLINKDSKVSKKAKMDIFILKN
jgi:hypothetical protein